MSAWPVPGRARPAPVELYVRGRIPPEAEGSLVVACSRRVKDKTAYCRWHEAPTDLIRLDLHPGRPGRVVARILEIGGRGPPGHTGPAFRDPSCHGAGDQPNHGVNAEAGTVWATNLLFGAPVEVELESWTPRRVVRPVDPISPEGRVSSTSHFAWGPDRRRAYFHQSALEPAPAGAEARGLRLVELDTRTGSTTGWRVAPPAEDREMREANFHSAFCWEEDGVRHVGLLRTGAVVESLRPDGGDGPPDRVERMSASTVWDVPLDPDRRTLQARLLPGVRELDGLALSHLAVDASGGDGFVLYANYKEADIAEDTRGRNVYGEAPGEVAEHYPGMIVEALNFGQVVRYEHRGGETDIRTFRRPYRPGRTSAGHSWLPINLELDSTGQRLFGSFNGFRPRLLSRHLAEAYRDRTAEMDRIQHIPPLLMRFDADTLRPDEEDGGRGHLRYGEPVAFSVVGEDGRDFVCTFSPELGVRIFRADDLGEMVAHAVAPDLLTWRETHFRPEPAHMEFVRR